jgi:hypothetical protein
VKNFLSKSIFIGVSTGSTADSKKTRPVCSTTAFVIRQEKSIRQREKEVPYAVH